MRIHQIGGIVGSKAVCLGRQAQVEALAGGCDDLGRQQRRTIPGGAVRILPRRVLDLDLPRTPSKRVARPCGLEGDASTAVDIEQAHDIALGQRQLALGHEAGVREVVRSRARGGDVAQIPDDLGHQVEQLARAVVKRRGHVHERELLAIGERPVALPGIDEAVDVLDHVRDGTAADTQLEAPRETRGEERAVVRGERGLEHRRRHVGVGRRHQAVAVRLDLLAAPPRQVIERREQIRARGHRRGKREVGVDGGGTGRGERAGDGEPFALGGSPRGHGRRGLRPPGSRTGSHGARAHGGAQPLDALDPGAIDICQRRRDRMFAHARVADRRRAVAAVVDDLALVQIELDMRAVHIAARAAHAPVDHHDPGETRVAVLEPLHGAVEHEGAPLHEGIAQRRLAPQNRDERPLSHMLPPIDYFHQHRYYGYGFSRCPRSPRKRSAAYLRYASDE